ncbi:hypothetical protein BDD12DRAFT_979450 [Trichophaea hybrida]|nr:hypothetical protein BDD12DRAFT_979450 [Trichophaea hybrida]
MSEGSCSTMSGDTEEVAEDEDEEEERGVPAEEQLVDSSSGIVSRRWGLGEIMGVEVLAVVWLAVKPNNSWVGGIGYSAARRQFVKDLTGMWCAEVTAEAAVVMAEEVMAEEVTAGVAAEVEVKEVEVVEVVEMVGLEVKLEVELEDGRVELEKLGGVQLIESLESVGIVRVKKR